MTHTRRAIMHYADDMPISDVVELIRIIATPRYPRLGDTGLAAAPLAATTPAASPDPIFAVIERYRRAGAALGAADEAHYAAAGDEHIAAYGALLNTAPTTLTGCRALIEHVVAYAADEVGEDCPRTLVALAEVLQRRDRPAAA